MIPLTRETVNPVRIVVTAESGDDRLRFAAVSLARELALPYLEGDAISMEHRPEFVLALSPARLELRETCRGSSRPIYVDFVGGAAGYRRVSGRTRRQPIAQAVGLRNGPVSLVDATAGLGRDSFLLACLGCTVTAIERSPVLAALVHDGIARAGGRSPKLDEVLARLRFVLGDARDVLRTMTDAFAPDTIYIDPMYPPSKKSALVKKEMRVCRRLVGDDPDAGELFDLARRVAKKRVVVKRQPHAPPLGPKPTTTCRGTRVRYDVYVVGT
ncbi:MAG: class I SAM-dependent methyltransferase [Planctomycetota bacterium]